MSDSLAGVRVVLALRGDRLDFEAMSRAGLPEPHTRTRRGEKQAPGWPPAPETCWTYERQQRADSIENPLVLLLDELEPFREDLVEMLSRDGVIGTVLVTVTIKTDRPIYCLSAATIRRLASWGVEFSLDIFDYSE